MPVKRLYIGCEFEIITTKSEEEKYPNKWRVFTDELRHNGAELLMDN